MVIALVAATAACSVLGSARAAKSAARLYSVLLPDAERILTFMQYFTGVGYGDHIASTNICASAEDLVGFARIHIDEGRGPDGTQVLSPGAVKTELLDHISEADVQKANQDYVGQVGVPAETFARLVAFAISEPEEVGAERRAVGHRGRHRGERTAAGAPAGRAERCGR